MSEPRGSVMVTCILCVALVAGNLAVDRLPYGELTYLTLWPFAFILCTVIFARIMRGHASFL